jgi:O-methyltransferase
MSSARKAVVGLLDQIGAGKALRRLRRWRHGRRKNWTPLVPQEQFAACCRVAIEELAKHGHKFGDYLEFGVSRGTSFATMHDVLAEKGLNTVRLFGFDSFEGLPPEAGREGWKPGDFYSAISATRKYLKERGIDWTRSTLIKGWFKDTLNDETVRKFNIERASLIMVDCDIYSASRDALWFSEGLIGDHAVIFFDDWGSGPQENRIGQIEAFDEFLVAFPQLKVDPMPSYAEHARVFLVSRNFGLAPNVHVRSTQGRS